MGEHRPDHDRTSTDNHSIPFRNNRNQKSNGLDNTPQNSTPKEVLMREEKGRCESVFYLFS